MRTSLPRRSLAAIAVALLSGCASTERIRPDPAGHHPQIKSSLAEARAYCSAMRISYQRMIDRELVAERAMGTGLIALGGVIAGLAGFGAHRDAVAGTALLGGTAYAIGNWNLSRQRRAVYQEGIKALNCADEAVAIFDIPSERLEKIADAISALDSSLEAVRQSTRAVTELQRSAPVDSTLATEVQATLAEAAAELAIAEALRERGMKIAAHAHQAGNLLRGAVNRIDLEVDQAVGDTYPSLASIKQSVADLPHLAASLAPGSLVQPRFTTMLAGSGGPRPQSQRVLKVAPGDAPDTKALKDAVLQLAAHNEKLRSLVAEARSAIAGFDSAAASASLSSCNVAAASPLTVQPAQMTLKAGEEHPVIITGGTPGYRVQVQGSKPTGFEFSAPLGRDRSFQVRGSAALRGPHTINLLVSDSSEQFRTATVTITVPASEPAQPGPPSPPSNPLAARLDAVPEFTVNGTRVKLAPPAQALEGGRFQITIACLDSPATPLTRSAILTELKKQTVQGSSIEADLTAAGATAEEKLQIVGETAGCLEPSPQSRRRLKTAASGARSEEMAEVQRRLCLPSFLVDGRWGPVTAKAANRWRAKTRRVESAAPLTTEEKRQLLEAPAKAVTDWCAQ